MFPKKAPTRAIGALIAGLGGACDTEPANFITPVALQACVNYSRRIIRANITFDVSDLPTGSSSLVVYYRRRIETEFSPGSFTTDLETTVDLIGFPNLDSGRRQVTQEVLMEGDFLEGVEVQSIVGDRQLQVDHVEPCES